MDQQFSSFRKTFIDKAVGSPEVTFGILEGVIMNGYLEVLEEFLAGCVGLASEIQDVRDAQLNQLLRFECCLVRSHENPVVHLYQRNLANCLSAVYFAGTRRHVRKASARRVFFAVSVSRASLVLFIF